MQERHTSERVDNDPEPVSSKRIDAGAARRRSLRWWNLGPAL